MTEKHSYCIFSGELLDRLIDMAFVSAEGGASTYTPRQAAERLQATLNRIGRYFAVPHDLLRLASAPFETPELDNFDGWTRALINRLCAFAHDLNWLAAHSIYAHAPTLSDPVSDTIRLSWREYLSSLERVASEPGLALYSRCNCHYVVLGGFVLSATGFHGYNLYNRFARTPFNWH